MKLECNEIGLKLTISDQLLKRLYLVGMAHYPKEFGGLLVGRYSLDMKTCNIEETILPVKYKSSKCFFERGRKGLMEKLQVFYEQEPSLIYVGEWHTHPDMAPEPSDTDRKAISEISEHDDVLIHSPILMILGISKNKMEVGAYIQFKNKLYKYENEK